MILLLVQLGAAFSYSTYLREEGTSSLDQTYFSPYQSGSPWPHYRGLTNLNSGVSAFRGLTSVVHQWSFQTLQAVSATAVQDYSGNVYVGGQDSYLYSLNYYGSLLWKYQPSQYAIYSSPAIGLDGTLYSSSSDGTFVALTSQGSLKWMIQAPRVPATATSNASPAISSVNGNLIVSARYLFSVSSIGSLSWVYPKNPFGFSGNINTSPAINSVGTVFVGCDDSYLYAVNSTGNLLWKFRNATGQVNSPAIDSNGMVITTQGGSVLSVTAKGSLNWYYTMPLVTQSQVSSCPAIYRDNSIYVGTTIGTVLALSPGGSLLWIYKLAGVIGSIPTISFDGILYFGAGQKIYTMSVMGSLISTYTLGESGSTVASVSLGLGGNLYVGLSSNSLVSLTAFSSAPPSSGSSESITFTTAVIVGMSVGVCCGVFLVLGVLVYWRNDRAKHQTVVATYETAENSPWNSNFLRRILSNSEFNQKVQGDNPGPTRQRLTSSLLKTLDDLDVEPVPLFDATDFVLSESANSIFVGRGAFGVVVRARFNPSSSYIPPGGNVHDVAIKVILNRANQVGTDSHQNEKKIRQAVQEVRVMLDAEEAVSYKCCIVKAYGVMYGILPPHLREAANFHDESNVVGIVMRYESGGSLSTYIHPKNVETHIPLSYTSKIKVLLEVARGLSELHSAGIIHGDVKPENVLLSSENEARLADFGLSATREQSHNSVESSLEHTSHFRGTPIYCAPEMLVNPFADTVKDTYAKPSRKTDMYAFSILAWEVLTEQKPFDGIRSEVTLASRVHQGFRPPITSLPIDCPEQIVNMIKTSWSEEREKRKSGVECWALLQHHYKKLTQATNFADEICLFCEKSHHSLAEFLYQRLTHNGLNIILQQTMAAEHGEAIEDERYGTNLLLTQSNSEATLLNESMSAVPLSSGRRQQYHAIVVILARSTQVDSFLRELRRLKVQRRAKHFVPLFLDPDYNSWVNPDVSYVCKLRDPDTLILDISPVRHISMGLITASTSENTLDYIVSQQSVEQNLTPVVISQSSNRRPTGKPRFSLVASSDGPNTAFKFSSLLSPLSPVVAGTRRSPRFETKSKSPSCVSVNETKVISPGGLKQSARIGAENTKAQNMQTWNSCVDKMSKKLKELIAIDGGRCAEEI